MPSYEEATKNDIVNKVPVFQGLPQEVRDAIAHLLPQTPSAAGGRVPDAAG